MPKPSLQKNYLTHNSADMGAHMFPKDISPKVNVRQRMKFESIYFETAVQYSHRYTTGTPV